MSNYPPENAILPKMGKLPIVREPLFYLQWTSTHGNFHEWNLNLILPIRDVVVLSDFKSDTFNSFEKVMLIIYAML